MSAKRGFLKTRVARRLFLTFIVCAFLPLATLAALSFSLTRTLLLEQGDQRLAATGKAYGMGVFERLLLAVELAGATAGLQHTFAEPGPVAQRVFRTLSIVDGSGGHTSIIGRGEAPLLAPATRERAGSGSAVAAISEDPPRLAIQVVVPSPHAPGEFVVGEIRPAFLWGPPDELPTATELCVVEEGSRRVLNCYAPGGEGPLRAFAASAEPSGAVGTWTRDGQAHRGYAWGQFMRAVFGTPDWIVVASQPEAYYLGRLMAFRQVYVPVVLLALLLVSWLTYRQSRNIVDPVSRLAERARGIAGKDFDTRLNLQRDDEFGELGVAMDQMSRQLGRQFASLTALSEIDRLILNTQDTTQVVRSVLQRLGEAMTADAITLTLFDHDNRDQARTYFIEHQAGGGFAFQMARDKVSAEDHAMLAAAATGRWMDLFPEMPLPRFMARARELGMGHAYLQPIVWRGAVCGTLVLGYRTGAQASEEEKQGARELADRVAVAVSSARRDEQLYAQAHFDPLTGSPNRLLFRDRLDMEIGRSRREGLTFGLLFIDLDHFKNVNDSFGHTAGDEVLREAAARIARCIRSSDSMARQGGDEFTVMLTGLRGPQEAWQIAEAIVEALSQEFVVGEARSFLGASVGIASYPADGATAEELLKRADTAMYRAKAGGRAQAVFFEERMNSEAVARLALDRDLRVAIERRELVLHYQPLLDLRTGAIRGAEALVRWMHPTRGLISPARFIPLAEESGFIDQIGQWTLEQACTQMKHWAATGLLLDHIAVNVSPRQFRKRGLVEFIARCVSAAGLRPSQLHIEITEGLLIERGEATEAMLGELAAAGHGIALDDFGTGFSSMAYLKRLPVDTIKIDRVFIDGMEPGNDAEVLVSAIIAMSHALGKVVVAEGVETRQQAQILERLNCNQIQGWLIAPAMPAEEFALFCSRHAPKALSA